MKKNFWLLILILIISAGGIIYSLNKSRSRHDSAKTQIDKTLPKESLVTLNKNGFTPTEVSIKEGGAVRWKNTSGADQTVNSNDYPTNQLHKELNFGMFKNGSSFVHIFSKTGYYGYHNQLHHEQTGKIIVTQ